MVTKPWLDACFQAGFLAHSTLNMGVIYSSEMSVTFQRTMWYFIQKDGIIKKLSYSYFETKKMFSKQRKCHI
jgi:hypothetical protein